MSANVVSTGYLDDKAVPESRQLYRLEGAQDNTQLGANSWSQMTAAQWAAMNPTTWSNLKP